MDTRIITKEQKHTRTRWIAEINELSGNFGADTNKLEKALHDEIQTHGRELLVGHLRLCGVIPEEFGHDTSEEKLYSKYTDILLAESFRTIGMPSIVLKERADAADVECVAKEFSFVADAKAFRLSRTAKNQKDFKVQAMADWKRGKPFAMIVCPIFQLPAKSSQIYQQAAAHSVCIFSYAHLSVLVRFSSVRTKAQAQKLLLSVFRGVESLHPSKNAADYWQTVNRNMLDFDEAIKYIWIEEKTASLEAISLAKVEAFSCLARERERLMRLSHEQAINELVRIHKIESKEKAVRAVADNGLLSLS